MFLAPSTSDRILRELELGLIQTHMVQKPMLRVEGEKGACVLGVLV